MATVARYDAHADWYDTWSRGDAAPVMAAARAVVLELLPPGDGVVVDLGCGTGLPAAAVAATGRPVLAVDLSADQVRLARTRTRHVVVGDATRVPVRDAVAAAVYSVLTHTDVDDFAGLVDEAIRVVRPGGAFVYVGVHPCFNNPVTEPVDEGVLVHAGYREAGRRPPSTFRTRGITQRVGVHHRPLADLLTAFLRPADAVVDRIVECGGGPVPPLLAVRLIRSAG